MCGQVGLLLTTYRDASSGKTVPTGDNAADIALIKQVKESTSSLGQGVVMHQTVALDTAKNDDAPLVRQAKAAVGTVDGKVPNVAKQNAGVDSTVTQGKAPHQSGAIAHLAGRAGLVMAAGQDLQLANGESITLDSGQDTNLTIGKQVCMHAGWAIGVAADLSKASDNSISLQLTVGQDNIDVQTQHDVFKPMIKQDLKLVSANMNMDFAAAKHIHIATAGGVSIILGGENITVECAGATTYKVVQRTFQRPTRTDRDLPLLPQTPFSTKKRYPFSVWIGFCKMLISPLFLPSKVADQTEDQWFETAMSGDEPENDAYPVSYDLGWHGGLHLTAPSRGNSDVEPVRAIADGTVIYRRGSAESPVPSEENAPFNYRGRTSDGVVVIRHETEIGVTTTRNAPA